MALRPSFSLCTEMIATNTKMMGMGPILIKFIITIPIFLFTGNAWESSTLIILIVIGQCFRVLRYTAAYFVRDDCMLEGGGGNLKLESEQAAGAPAGEQDASAPEGSPSSSEADAAAKEERGTPCMEQPFMLGLCCKNVLFSVLVRLIFATFSGKQAALTTHHSPPTTHHSLTTHHSPLTTHQAK